MGWFIGITGRDQSLKDSILSLTSSNDFNVETESFFLLAGGHHQTTHSQLDEYQQTGWVASGIGISSGEDPKLYNLGDWDQAIRKGVDHLYQINGHFAVCRWNHLQIELITDQLGMRNVFIHRSKDFVLFSTRLVWIKKLIPHATINWEKFGSRWLTINQFSNGSFIHGVERISQGGYATINSEEVSISNNRWSHSHREVNPQSFINALSNFSTLPLKQGQPLSLGLSGGLDSRTLFAILLHQSNSNWTTHTFGEANHPDLKTATLLNGFYDKEHYVFEESIPETKETEELLPDFIGQTMLTSTPSHFVGFQAYKKIQDLGLSVIDGGFGEIARRRFMNNILLRAKNRLTKKRHPGFNSLFTAGPI